MMQFRHLLYLAFVLACLFGGQAKGQISSARLLYFETFNDPASVGAVFNPDGIVTSLGPVSNTGENRFVQGQGFEGTPPWPSVPRQLGDLGFVRPDEGYAYIRSNAALTTNTQNANFNPGASSDRFLIIGRFNRPTTFCTRGFERIEVKFYWIGQGDRNDGQMAGAELYYSTNGGSSWQPYRDERGNRFPLIDNSGQWNYGRGNEGGFSMTDWVGVTELCFGFRWRNNRMNNAQLLDENGILPISFGLDDFSVVGFVRPDGDPNAVNIDVRGREFCQGDGIPFLLRYDDPTCRCQIVIELSNPQGGFNVGSTEIQRGVIGMDVWEGGVDYNVPAGISSIPISVPPGSGYCLRVTRVCDLEPRITSSNIVCGITIRECPPPVQLTHKPPTSNDDLRDTICVLSVFDVPFNTELGNSRFLYPDNNYLIEISDENGLFFDELRDANGNIIRREPVYLPGGLFNDPRPYPIRNQPGLITSYIPEFYTNNPQVRFKESCKYRIRVVSTSPPSYGAPWGPFCVRYCDIETNSTDQPDPVAESGQTERDLGRQQNVIFCVNDYDGASMDMEFDINEWIKLASEGKIDGFDPLIYLDPNTFWVELWAGSVLNGQLTFLHRGRIGSIEQTTEGTVKVSFPPLDGLYSLGLIPTPGILYLRIVADNADYMDPSKSGTPIEPFGPGMPGTFIRVTLGFPYRDNTLYLLGDAATGYCASEIVFFDFGVHRFDPNKGSCYVLFGKFYIDEPTPQQLEEDRQRILRREQGGADFQFGPLCPAQGWFTQNALATYRPDPTEPPIQIGRHQIAFRIPPDFQGLANYVYIFAQEENGRDARGNVCRSDVSRGQPIKLLSGTFSAAPISDKGCVGDVIPFYLEIPKGSAEESVFDLRLIESRDDINKRLNLAANDVDLVTNNANYYALRFNRPGIYYLRAEALNRCGSFDDVFEIEIFDKPTISGIEPRYELCEGDQLVITPSFTSSTEDIFYRWLEILPDGTERQIQAGNESRYEEVGRMGPERTLLFEVQDQNFEACRITDTTRILVGKFELDAGPEQHICFGEEVTLRASDGNTWNWRPDSSILSQNLNQRSIRAMPVKTTTYIVSGDGFALPNRLCPDTAEVTVNVYAPTDASETVAVCEGNTNPILLDAKNPGAKYEWNKIVNGVSQYLGNRQQIRVRDIARYTVSVTAPDRTEPCFIQEFDVIPVEVGAPIQTPMSCTAREASLKAGVDGGIYQWSTGATTQEIRIFTPGMYWVDIYFDGRLCARQTFVVRLDCPQFAINPPNAFTPNRDANNLNEYWRVWIPGITKYTCRIYDRWGNPVWEDIRGEGGKAIQIDTDRDGSMHQAIMWDGMINGEIAKEGVYVYVIEAQSGTGETIKLVGNITVLF